MMKAKREESFQKLNGFLQDQLTTYYIVQTHLQRGVFFSYISTLFADSNKHNVINQSKKTAHLIRTPSCSKKQKNVL